MGTLISRLDPQQSNVYNRSLNELIDVIRQQDTALAQILEHITKPDSGFDLKEFSRHLKSTSIYSDHSSPLPVNQPLSPPCARTRFEAYKRYFEQLQPGIQEVLKDNLPRWRGDPFIFWGRIDTLSQLALPAAVQRLNRYIEGFEKDSIVSPMRRRLSLVVLCQLQEVVEARVEHLLRNSRFRLEKGTTFKYVSSSFVRTLVSDQKGGKHFAARLRAGERYSRLPTGMLLALGNVPHDGMERCSSDEFKLIEKHCKQFSPCWVAELGELATVLMRAIWNDKDNITELDLDIELFLKDFTHITTNKDNVSHGKKRRHAGGGDRPSKEICLDSREHNTPTVVSEDLDVHRTTHGRIEEKLIAARLSAKSPQEQRQYHSSPESIANDRNDFGLDLRISDPTQEVASINTEHNTERHIRQINSAPLEHLPFDLNPNFVNQGIDQQLPFDFFDDPAALQGTDQQLPFDFFDDPAALHGADHQLPFDFFDDPAALQGTNTQLPFDIFDDPPAQPGINQRPPSELSGVPAVRHRIGQGLHFSSGDIPILCM